MLSLFIASPYISSLDHARSRAAVTNQILNQKQVIQQILASTRTIAVVGLSSRQSRPGYYVPAYLQNQGYRIIPVNPSIASALGERSYPDLSSVPEKVDLVLVFRRSDAVLPVVEEAISVGVKAVWMQAGIINEDAARIARQAGLKVIMDACMMVEHRRSNLQSRT